MNNLENQQNSVYGNDHRLIFYTNCLQNLSHIELLQSSSTFLIVPILCVVDRRYSGTEISFNKSREASNEYVTHRYLTMTRGRHSLLIAEDIFFSQLEDSALSVIAGGLSEKTIRRKSRGQFLSEKLTIIRSKFFYNIIVITIFHNLFFFLAASIFRSGQSRFIYFVLSQTTKV